MPYSLHRANDSRLWILIARSWIVLAVFCLSTLGHAQSGIRLVQSSGIDVGISTTGSLPFVAANTTGNWIGVVVRGGLSSSQVFTVTDSNGNTYRKAVQIGFNASAVSLAIYYAENIKGGANTITVSDTVSGPFRFAILEYAGVASSGSLDVTAAATGTSTIPNSGNVSTTASGDLLLGAMATTNTGTFTGGGGYKVEDFVPAEPNTKLITEDQIQAIAGTASASGVLGASDTWGTVLGAFKAAASGGAASGGAVKPQITAISPTSGPVGSSVTITGINFGSTQSSSTVTFNGIAAKPTSWSATSITAQVPSGATTGSVIVTMGGLASNGITYTVSVTTAGQMSSSASSLSFGSVNVGSSSTQSVTLTNSGGSSVSISNVTISGAGFSVNGISTGLILNPGATATMNVIFAPAGSGSVAGSVTIASNASNSPLTISFSGTGVVVTHSAALAWHASTSVVAGYNVYRSSISGGPYTKLTSSPDANTTFTDSSVLSGHTYYYVVTAVNSNNVESVYSNQANAVIP